MPKVLFLNDGSADNIRHLRELHGCQEYELKTYNNGASLPSKFWQDLEGDAIKLIVLADNGDNPERQVVGLRQVNKSIPVLLITKQNITMDFQTKQLCFVWNGNEGKTLSEQISEVMLVVYPG